MTSPLTNKPASEWLLEVGPLAKRLNEESLGDLAAPTVATPASPRAGSRLGHTGSVNYRKGSVE